MKSTDIVVYSDKNQEEHFNDVSDSELILQILVIFEEVGSLCPEKLIRRGTHLLFGEAYRRFGTWDKIINQCIVLSNIYHLFENPLMSPSEIMRDILKIENFHGYLDEETIRDEHPLLHKSAMIIFGSWHQALVISGIKEYDCKGRKKKRVIRLKINPVSS